MTWLQGHNAYSRLPVAEAATAYMSSIQEFFQTKGLRITFLRVTRMDLTHAFDCGDAGIARRILEELKQAGELGRYRRTSYDNDGVVWGQGNEKSRVSSYLDASKSYGPGPEDVDPKVMGRMLRFELRLNTDPLSVILGKDRAPIFDTVNWQKIFLDHLSGLRIAANPVLVTIDDLSKYPNLTKAEYGAICQWILGRVPVKTNAYLRGNIVAKTRGEIDIGCSPTLASPWSAEALWSFLRKRCATHTMGQVLRSHPAGTRMTSSRPAPPKPPRPTSANVGGKLPGASQPERVKIHAPRAPVVPAKQKAS